MTNPVALAITSTLLLGIAAPVRAEMYSWEDERGTLHFSEDSARAPARERVLRAGAAGSQLNRMAQSLSPASVRVAYQDDANLIRVMVRINDEITAPFYVDTGSTELVVPKALADRLARTMDLPQARGKLGTAIGEVDVALVQLASVRLGDAEVADVWAAVAPELEVGLLGGAFLNQFQYSIDPETQIISLTPRKRS